MKLTKLRLKLTKLSLLTPILLSLIVTGVSAVIYNQISVSMRIQAEDTPIIFTNGEDTLSCGGHVSMNSTQVTFAKIPLSVESDIVITQLINITNIDSIDHGLKISATEHFGSELSSLQLYLVSPSGTETLVLKLDDYGNSVTENISVNIPQGQEWTIKLVGHYDSGTSSYKNNSMILRLQVTT